MHTSNRRWPANWPPLPLMHPTSSKTLTNSRSCLFPVAKSLGSCAGVIFTQPVPKLMSTSSASQTIGILRPSTGWTTCLPWRCLYLGTDKPAQVNERDLTFCLFTTTATG
eukprot:scaffold564654_cov23-Prasinocladus_malaysianus.AAC.1